MQDFFQNYVNGSWIDGGGGRLSVNNPGTGEYLAEVALADAADIDRAVAAALACHESGALSDLRPVERSRMVCKMGQFILDNKSEIAELLCLESGKPLWDCLLYTSPSPRDA